MNNLPQTEQEWKEKLSEEEYKILRLKGTERPFTGEYDKFFEKGYYCCKACGEILFESEHKFDSGCGWPAFYKGSIKEKITEKPDYTYGMIRVEVLCSNCNSHLGHVFDEMNGTPTNRRFCINSLCLVFTEEK